jgi:LDH2 family malate/lactate/ureidoglycolate dehydrogenase
MGRIVNAVKYEAFLVKALEKSGFDNHYSKIIANLMVENEKLGIATHGSFHLNTYIKKIHAGSINPKGAIEVVMEGPAFACIEANANLGFAATYDATELAIKKAKETGISYVLVRGSSHFGSCAPYTLMAADEGMAAIICSNTWKLMAVPGSKSKVIGNSPIGYAFPAGKHDNVFLDVATSEAALSKVIRSAESKQEVPLGWIADEDGLPTTDPTSPNFSLVPFGAHKGYGFAFMIEVLAGVASGGGFLNQVGQDWMTNIDLFPNVCHAIIVIDIQKILGKEAFEARMDACIDEIHNSPKAKGSDRIYVPGEIEMEKKKHAEKHGIELMDAHVARMYEVCKLLDIEMEDVFVN